MILLLCRVLPHIIIFTNTEIIVHLADCPVVTSEDNETAAVCASVSVPLNEETTLTLLLMDGTAVVGSDYSGSSHQVVFSSGQSRACVSIPLADDDECEVTESFTVKLSDPSIVGSYFLGQPKTCTVSIEDDDSMYAVIILSRIIVLKINSVIL